MRFMLLVKATKDSEAGALPKKDLLAAMAEAGVLLAGEGLQASSKGARIKFSGAKRFVTDGPFAETKELKSRQEAVDWASRVPFTDGEELEVRQVFEASDFPSELFPPEAVAREEALREELRRKAPRP